MSAGTRDGGKPEKSGLAYNPPVGPKGINHQGPGLGGDNYGNGQDKVCNDPLSPSRGGTNHGNAGSQGTH